MGKLGSFIEVSRREQPERDPRTRTRDFNEFVHTLPVEGLREQGGRCMECGVPFCHNGCPLGNLIPDWNDLVYRDRWREAIVQLHATNNFPEFTGRLCPAPCEAACVLEIREGDAVSIKQIEVSIVNRAWDEGWIVPQPPAVETGRTVAVIGAGPEPITATERPVFAAGGCGTIHPSSQPRLTIASSICLIETASPSSISSTQAASHGAGHRRPVSSGKLFVRWSWSRASRQRSR